MSSRATAALLRLKEIDQKYKSSREKTFEQISEISTVSSDEKTSEVEKSRITLLRPQLNIKLPDTFVENLESLSSNADKNNTPVRVFTETSKSSSISLQSERLEKKGKNEEINIVVSSRNSETDVKSSHQEEIENSSKNTDESVSEILEQITEASEEVSESINCSMSKQNRIEDKIDEIYGEGEQLNIDHSNSEEYSEDSFESASSDTETEDSSLFENSVEEISDNLVDEDSKKIDFRPKDNEIVEHELKDHETIIDRHDSRNESGEGYENDITIGRCDLQDVSSGVQIIHSNIVSNEASDFHTESVEYILRSEKKSDSGTSTETSRTPTNDQNSTRNMKNSSCEERFSEHKSDEIKSFGTTESISEHEKKDRRSRKSNRKSFEKERTREKAFTEQKKSNLSMSRYLRQVEEDRQRFLVWPTRLLCSNKAQLTVFEPLEIPNAFDVIPRVKTQNDANQCEDPCLGILRNRLLDIGQWLKDQYSIYKEQCNLAASINSNYKPSSLEDAEKIIRHLRLRSRHNN